MRLGLAITVLALAAPHSALAQREYMIPLLLADGDPQRHGFVRIINRSDSPGTVSIVAIDDEGERSETLTLTLDARATSHFNSNDLENGNPSKGLRGRAGSGAGDWRLQLTADIDIEPLAYVRTKDGFLTAMNDIVPNGTYIPFFNPASNRRQRSLLRVINPTANDLALTLVGQDDSGEVADDAATGIVSFELKAGAARTLSAQDLEAGGEGLDGSFGDGDGKWKLFFFGEPPVLAMSLLESHTDGPADGQGTYLTNLSSLPAYRGRTLPLMLSNHDPVQHGFVRIVNSSDESGFVDVRAIDDAGMEAGLVTLRMEPRRTLHFRSRDLEQGAPDKGIHQGLGTGSGSWRLVFNSNLYLLLSAFVRTQEGFLTAMHDTARRAGRQLYLPTFNPASNTKQRSLLRLVNPSDQDAEVEITGTDDLGNPSASNVRLSLPAHASRTISAQELESGDGLHGRLGDGDGKWQLHIGSNAPLFAMSLLSNERTQGWLTNLSRGYHEEIEPASDSYKLNGRGRDAAVGTSIASAGDMDRDGVPELIVGAPAHDSSPNNPNHNGSAYLVFGASLSRLDAQGGAADGQIDLDEADPRQGLWKLVGEPPAGVAGASVASVADLDGDGRSEVLLGSPGFSSEADQLGAAYLISSGRLSAVDAADGAADGVVAASNIAAQPGSWKFLGERPYDAAGSSVAAAGDINGDQIADFLIGAPTNDVPDPADGEVAPTGAAYLVSGASLPAADRADGRADGVIELEHLAGQRGSWKFVGEHAFGEAGASVAMVGDMNRDGLPELVVGDPSYSEPDQDGEPGDTVGAAYVISPSDLVAMDEADGDRDGIVGLANVAAQPRSWKLTGADEGQESGDFRVGQSVSSAGDVDGDGRADLLVSPWNLIHEPGPIYLITAAALPKLEEAGAESDGAIDLGMVGSVKGSWRLEAKRHYWSIDIYEDVYFTHPSAVALAGDVDGNGLSDILIGTRNGGWDRDEPSYGWVRRAAFLLSGQNLPALDAQDGSLDGTIDLDAAAFEASSSWQFIGEGDDNAGVEVSSAGDMNGDGLSDILIGANRAGDWEGATYVLSAADLPALDRADGYADGVIRLGNVVRRNRVWIQEVIP